MSRLSRLREPLESLPDVNEPRHEVSHGILARYQDKLVSRYQNLVQHIQDQANNVTSECRFFLTEQMNNFKQAETEICAQQKAICDSLGTSKETFESLKESIQGLSDKLHEKATKLREDSIKYYEDSFLGLNSCIQDSYKQCADYLPQIPPAYADLLPSLISKLNVNYLKTKQDLLKAYYAIDLNVMNENKAILAEFDQRSFEWKDNRFATIVNDAKEKLNPYNPLDLSPLFRDFHEEQAKFTLCCRKLIQNVSLVWPPNNFTQEDFDKWWNEVEDILNLHQEFIGQYIKKVQTQVDEKNNENNEYISSLETELVSLKDETEASQAIASIMPLLRQAQKYNTSIIEKCTKYWENRKDALRKSFEAIKNFVNPIITEYNEYVDKMTKLKNDAEEEQKECDKNSEELLQNYENELNEKTEEIKVLVDQQKMKERVDECKEILGKIEVEYRDHYAKIIAILEKQPQLVVETFDHSETNILNLLKLKKIESSKEFEESQTGTSRSSKAPTKPGSAHGQRNARRNKQKEAKQQIVNAFSFTLDNGAKYEESEPLIIIPVFDEFNDEPETPQHGKGGKGKQPAKKQVKTPQKPKKPGQKGKAEEYEEIEGPEFTVADTIEKIDGNVAVSVFTPSNDEIIDWLNSFRKTVVDSISELFATEMRRINDPEIKEKLADQLNERLRTHAPRGNAIELNIAQARTLEVEGRKMQLEKHFRHAVMQFNQSCTNLDATITRKKTNILNECEKLNNYITDLEKQKSTNNFALLYQNFHISERQFLQQLQQVISDMNKEVENFSSYTNTSSERFIKNILDDPNCPQEEKDMSSQYLDRMKQQVEGIITQMREKIETEFSEVSQKCTEITTEFDSLLPLHKSDVAFIELLNSAAVDAKSKFDSLLFRNKLKEQDIEKAIQDVADAQEVKGDPQTVMNKQFAALDALRVQIAKRATYLSLLNNQISIEPMKFDIVLGEEQASPKPLQETQPKQDTRSKRPRSKRSNERDKKPTDKKSQRGEQKNPPAAVSEVLNPEIVVPFSTLLDQIGNDFTNSVSKGATDYYASLKGRKIGITRPEQIPATQPELLEAMTKKWQEISQKSTSVIEQSVLKFRTQLIQAATTTRGNSKIIYDAFEQFYTNLVLAQRSEVQQKFDADLKELNEEKLENKKLLTPALADSNNSQQFSDLLNNELERTNKESKLILDFQNNIIETERKVSQMFINQLPTVTLAALQLFDKFILVDDLNNGTAPGAKRRTMKEMLKDQKRKEEGGPQDAVRNARSRQWPGLPLIMAPLSVAPPAELERSKEIGQGSKGGSRKKKRRTLEKNASTSSKEVDLKVEEVSVSLTSLDTQLHRGTIVERNRCFDEYENDLKKRLDDFQEYTQSLVNDMNAFTTHWNKCVAQLRGESTVFATQ